MNLAKEKLAVSLKRKERQLDSDQKLKFLEQLEKQSV